MSKVETRRSLVVAVLLSAPCWWVDLGDCWEVTHHHATREDAEADRVRDDEGWSLSVTGTFTPVPGVTRQETHRCYRMTCPACDTVQHHHETRFVVCVECGHEFEIEQITRNDPNEVPLFDVPHLGT